jgi:hypothetical protein
VLLQNTIKHLFPVELARRRREHRALAAEGRAAAKGENGGFHKQGYEVLEGCEGDEARWGKVPTFGVRATRSLVLDSEDACRRIVLGMQLSVVAGGGCEQQQQQRKRRKKKNKQRFVCLDDKVSLSVFVLNIEEDEATDLPIHFGHGSSSVLNDDDNGDDDDYDDDDEEEEKGDHECLLMRTHSSPIEVSVASPGFSWERTVTAVGGAVSTIVPFGDTPGHCMVMVRDSMSSAELRFMIPVSPAGAGGGKGRSGSGGGGSSDDGSAGSGSEDEEEFEVEDLDEFEDDGFVVDDDDEEEEEEEEESAGSNNENWADVCGVCGGGTLDGQAGPVLICDCCNGEAHLSCLDIDEVPPGSWYCQICDGSAPYGQQSSSRGSLQAQKKEDSSDDEDLFGDEKDDTPIRSRRPTGKKRKGGPVLESDDDE